MAGTGLPGDEIMYLQGRLIGKAMGEDEKALARQLETQKRLFEIIETGVRTAEAAGADARGNQEADQ